MTDYYDERTQEEKGCTVTGSMEDVVKHYRRAGEVVLIEKGKTITYEQFSDYLNNIKELLAQEEAFGKMLEPFTNTYIFRLANGLADDMLRNLESIMGLDHEELFYFAFECEFGKKHKEVSFKDGTKFIMDSNRSLWDSIYYQPKEEG